MVRLLHVVFSLHVVGELHAVGKLHAALRAGKMSSGGFLPLGGRAAFILHDDIAVCGWAGWNIRSLLAAGSCMLSLVCMVSCTVLASLTVV